jgi:S1-C subfamily serine protease
MELPITKKFASASYLNRRAALALLTVLLAERCNATQSGSAPDVVTIARDATKSTVAVVTSDSSGKALTQGSGFLVSGDGKVLTNYHVIAGADSAIVKFPDGEFFEVDGFLGADPERDLAILKIRATGKEFPFIRLGADDNIEVGEHIVAIGSPLALEGTISDGIVSAIRDGNELSSRLPSGLRVIQITAPISPGSSGGALLNMRGEVIGITSFGVISGQNLNFAIPIKFARPLIASEQVKRLSELVPRSSKNESAQGITRIGGTYVGLWKSKLSGSGSLVLTVEVVGKAVRATVVITGSPSGYKGDSLIATNVRDMGHGIWAVDLRAEHSKLDATGIFKPDSFVGDFSYKFSAVRRPDRGKWIVNRQLVNSSPPES